MALIYPVTWIITGTAVMLLYEAVTRKAYVTENLTVTPNSEMQLMPHH
ncbi:hypothetical protein ACOBMG_00715 [Limosilactobacillus mucosae]